MIKILRATAFSTLFFFAGCSSRTASVPQSFDHATSSIGQELVEHYQIWSGTRYRLGGMSQSGVDCSSFVYLTYKDCFNLLLPRTTINQIRAGHRVEKSDLREGDLVFFRTGKHTRHVGIYIGKGRFMHASSSQGVTISQLQNPYWKKHYWFAKHIPELDTL